jgi:hypothetical protein
MNNNTSDLMGAERQIKSRERVAKHGEVFTAEREVNAMLDLVKQETERIESRFLEPACGDGNFLIEILRRKLAICETRIHAKQFTQLQYERHAVWAVSSIYGIELLPDNAEACRARLFAYFHEQYHRLFGEHCKAECEEAVRYILSRNIIMGDALTYRRVDNPKEWIVVSEWSFLGDGMVNRRDYEFSYLGGDSAEADLFSDTPCDTFPPIYFLNINENAYHEKRQ